ncbi:MAG: uroporphyrinogen-III synthase [Methanomassiliicoccaceae archaeon]|nr:uroporphyrinogen-III synthase [Methanomassiliicoccaceae archaeon]
MTTLAFTRPEKRLAESISLAEAAGFKVMAAPSLEIIPRNTEDIENMFRTIKAGDIVVFTSPTAVEECMRCASVKDSLSGTTVVSIGDGTSRALEDADIRIDTMPKEYSSEGIVKHLSGSVEGKRVLLIRSDRGARILRRGLIAAGAEDVTNFAAYHIMPADPSDLDRILEAGAEGKIDAFAFTSPLSARSFVEAAEKRIGSTDMLKNAAVAAIGGPTKNMLMALGIKVDIMPEKATFKDLLAAIKEKNM